MLDIRHRIHRTAGCRSQIVAAALLVASCVFALPAQAATIDFGNVSDVPFQPPEVYTEDGFSFTVVSGLLWGILTNAGNPPSGLAVGTFDAIGIGDTISVTRTAGGLFTFDAFDFASFNDIPSDAVSFIGRVAGVQTEVLPFVFSSSSVFVVAADPQFANPIDELLIVGALQGEALLQLDNFVLTPVGPAPVAEPVTLLLLCTGVGAVAARRRLKQRA